MYIYIDVYLYPLTLYMIRKTKQPKWTVKQKHAIYSSLVLTSGQILSDSGKSNSWFMLGPYFTSEYKQSLSL